MAGGGSIANRVHDGGRMRFGLTALDASGFEVAGDAESVEGAGVQGVFRDRIKSSSTRLVPEVGGKCTAPIDSDTVLTIPGESMP